MRQHKILTRTILIFSLINFVLAAPIAVRGRPERLDVNVTRNLNVTAAPQKRQSPGGVDPLADILSQAAYIDSPPPTPDDPEPVSPHHSQPEPSAPPSNPLTDMLSQMAHAPPTPDSDGTGSLTGSNHVSPGSGLTMGSPMPVAGFILPPPHYSQPVQYASPPSPLTDLSSQMGHVDTRPATPDSLGSYTVSDYVLSSPGLPIGSMPPSPHHSQPGPSADSTPPPAPLTDTSSQGVHMDGSTPTPDGPWLLTGSDYEHSSPGLLDGSMPVAGFPSHSPPSPQFSQPGPPAQPPSPFNTPMADFLMQEAHTDGLPSLPDSLWLWDNVLPDPGLPVGSESMPVDDYLLTPLLPPPHPSQFGESEGRLPSQSDFPAEPFPLWSSGSRFPAVPMPVPDSLSPPPPEEHLPIPLGFPEDFPLWSTGSRLPNGPMPVAGSHSLLPPSEDHFPSPLGFSVEDPSLWSTGSRFPDGPMPVAGPLSPHPPSEDHPPGHYLLGPSGSSVNPDALSATGPTDPPPLGSGVDTEMHFLLDPEPFPTEFWDGVLKGKIKRRIPGSGDVDLAQKDEFRRRRPGAAIPHGPLGKSKISVA